MFIIGYYLKFSRIISQTPWIVDDKMMYDSSIQEEISKIITDYYKCETSKFHSGVFTIFKTFFYIEFCI